MILLPQIHHFMLLYLLYRIRKTQIKDDRVIL